jgi:uncharacterized repeat protein (TIGR01451 family)
MRRYLTLCSFGFALAVLPAAARAAAEDEGTKPIYRTNAEIMREASLQQHPTEVQDRELKIKRRAKRHGLPQDPDAPALSRWAPGPAIVGQPRLPQALGTTFASVKLSEALAQPPDTMGAIGPTQFLTHVNGRVRVHAKANGAVGALDTPDMTFWNSVRTQGTGNFISDPRVRYDRLSDRWFTIIIDVPVNLGTNAGVSNRILLAVSDSSTVTGSSGWKFYYFNMDAPPPAGDTSCLADYPSLGIDANALYIGVNVFCGPDIDNLEFSNTTAWVVRKSTLLNAATPANLVATAGAVTAFRGLLNPTTFAGLYTPQGVDNDSPTANVGYFVGVDGQNFGRLVLRAVSNPGSGAPSLGPNVFINVPATEPPIPVDIPGTGPALDGIDDRLMNAVLRDGRIWTSHQIQVDASGAASPTGGRNGTRWYALDTATNTAAQVGTIFDSATSNPTSFWMASVNVSGQGHVAFGATVAGAATSPGAATTGRLAGDPTNTTQGTPGIYKGAEGNYVQTSDRWGDYSMTSLDPCDDMSLWTIQEFAALSNNWGTQVARLLAPPPGAPTTATPSLPQGQPSLKVALTGANWYNPPATGMSSCRTSIGVTVGGGVTVNSVTYVSPTRIDVDLSTVSATVGAKTVTVTNPDGQAAAAAIVSVVSAPVISATKTVATAPSGPFVPGAGITYTVTLRNIGTFTQGDNPGNELTDVLPSAVTLVSASASSGTAVATVGTNTVTWNGGIPANGGSVTITIQATVKLLTLGGSLVSNQGTVSYDADANGTNEATLLTDDPGQPGGADPTTFYLATRFYTLSPCRLVDTRSANAPALGPGSRSFTLAGTCSLPADARAVSLNVTVTGPTQQGNLRLFPSGAGLPLVSTINYSPGQTRANNAIAVLSAAGALTVQCDQAGGTTELIIDVNGYFK